MVPGVAGLTGESGVLGLRKDGFGQVSRTLLADRFARRVSGDLPKEVRRIA
jgi:hypothetical protein